MVGSTIIEFTEGLKYSKKSCCLLNLLMMTGSVFLRVLGVTSQFIIVYKVWNIFCILVSY